MERISSTDYDILGADYDAFKRVGLVVRDHEGEYKEVKANFDLMNSSRTKANIYVLLNLACNLDCPYCFEKASKDGSFISERVTMAFVERVKADVIGKGTSVTMNFYGGEPMLSYGRMVRLSEEVREACAAGGVGYDAKMVSNGTLLDRAKAERLKQAGVRGVKLTLDGPEEVHDRMRPYKDGRKGSFKDTVRNAGEYADVGG